ncbi:MAG: alpha/beta fold hydrolase [Pseudomonadales bacterium]|nr:alpha/beta fold hydrolase [Pseudomonadales bacterium]
MNLPQKEQIIISGDSHIYVVEYENPGKPTMLLVHGFPDCHKTWSKQIEEFKKDYHVIALDTRGVGKSNWYGSNEGFVLEEVIKDFAAVITTILGEHGKVHLVGHDWGSALCWRFISNPEYAKYILSYTSMSAPDPYIFAFWFRDMWRTKKMKPLFNQFRKSWYIYLFNFLPYPAVDFVFNRNILLRELIRFHGMERDDPYLYRDFKGDGYFQIGLYKENFRSIINNMEEKEPPFMPDIPIHVIIFENDGALEKEACSFCGTIYPQIEFSSLPIKHFGLHSHAHLLNPIINRFIQNNVSIDAELLVE